LILESLELFMNSGKWNEKMEVRTDFTGPVNLVSDPEQIRQVLWNIFLNAVEAMPEGGIIRISTESVLESGREKVRIKVRDTGPGFSKKALSSLFTPFFTTKDGGTGLGLAIVKRIVEGLRGRVYGASPSGGGAEITVLLGRGPDNV
jgi:signal transduction histidine kinase